ncbi:phosphate/phosphite/phosphonate ABC transporter substrate-binding protein [Polaromonas sp. A23]|uniref:phosphate/phosphite/phosphonate ABC transporter substrate-binding protein n=1 Tax=Polaromonas sp. A23 TaxID=1944133 RepID=UPI000987348A|nr:PhnD/SsuA/transferrin family substrate-binding protein [Polaromonas sp. A23]OOG36759.1 phosphate ABC transporter substrate-binding protein [Polaromonas sp. A23]
MAIKENCDFYKRHLVVAGGLTALAGSSALWAQVPATPAAPKKAVPLVANANGWRLLINEAVTGETNSFVLTSRYRPLADFLSTQFKGRQIGVEPIVDIKRFMSMAQSSSKPDLVFGKSVNQLAKLVRDSGYQPLVRRADAYKAAFIVNKDSPIKTLADAGGVKILMPDESAATTAVALAELRRQKVAATQVTHLKFQEAVAQQIKSGMGQVGVVNPTTAKKWVEEGGRVIAETQPVVNWSLLAGPRMPAEMVQQLREALFSMNTQASPVLMGLGVKEWAKAERKDYLDLLDYTKE